MSDNELSSDKAIFEVLKTELFTAVVGDVLDVLGYQRQFLPAGPSSSRAAMAQGEAQAGCARPAFFPIHRGCV